MGLAGDLSNPYRSLVINMTVSSCGGYGDSSGLATPDWLYWIAVCPYLPLGMAVLLCSMHCDVRRPDTVGLVFASHRRPCAAGHQPRMIRLFVLHIQSWTLVPILSEALSVEQTGLMLLLVCQSQDRSCQLAVRESGHARGDACRADLVYRTLYALRNDNWFIYLALRMVVFK